MKIRILLDLDEVLCDFERAACRAHGVAYKGVIAHRNWAEWELTGPLGYALGLGRPLTLDEFWKPIHAQGEQFWREIPPKPWMFSLTELVSSFDDEFLIVSAPSQCTTSRTGKFDWVKYHLGLSTANRLLLLGRKELIAGAHMFLIDDRHQNVVNFIQHGGSGMVFPSQGNNHAVFAHDPLPFVRQYLEELQSYDQLHGTQR